MAHIGKLNSARALAPSSFIHLLSLACLCLLEERNGGHAVLWVGGDALRSQMESLTNGKGPVLTAEKGMGSTFMAECFYPSLFH